MRKFARGVAVAGAGIALTAALSPVAHAADQAPAAPAAKAQKIIQVPAFEHAPTYKEATTKSPKVGRGVNRGETAPVICMSTTGWYKIADAGPAAVWAEAKHFNSVPRMPKC